RLRWNGGRTHETVRARDVEYRAVRRRKGGGWNSSLRQRAGGEGHAARRVGDGYRHVERRDPAPRLRKPRGPARGTQTRAPVGQPVRLQGPSAIVVRGYLYPARVHAAGAARHVRARLRDPELRPEARRARAHDREMAGSGAASRAVLAAHDRDVLARRPDALYADLALRIRERARGDPRED